MKKLNHLLLTMACGFGVALSAQGREVSPNNTALLASPRYLEEHPELLRIPSSQEPSALQRDRLARLTENTALANSPRFLEEHPELLRREPGFEVAPLK